MTDYVYLIYHINILSFVLLLYTQTRRIRPFQTALCVQDSKQIVPFPVDSTGKAIDLLALYKIIFVVQSYVTLSLLPLPLASLKSRDLGYIE